jgi:hypothetical protein
MVRLLGTVVVLVSVAAQSGAETKRYTAERFDVSAGLLRTGDLRVIETIVFRFEQGTFALMWHEIPRQHVDGIAVNDVRLDGDPLGDGEGPRNGTLFLSVPFAAGAVIAVPPAPAWFHAAAGDAHPPAFAFAGFVSSSGATSGGGAGADAAGGGGSGAA